MKINYNKSSVMWFSLQPQGNVPVITANDAVIKNVQQQKYL